MTRALIAVVSLVALGACSTRSDYTFTELAYPGAKSTVASGINAAGHVVGWYEQGDQTYGFLYKAGNYSTVQYPGAALTQLYGIGADGDIAGGFRMRDETNRLAYHGFLLTRSGEFWQVSHPDYKYGMAIRVLADGTIIGCSHQDDLATMRGMIVPGHAISAAGVTPAAIALLDKEGSMHNGATPDGSKVVGVLATRGEAYVFDRGKLTTFSAPDAKRTEAWDINKAGVIVGTFEDSESLSHGFVLEDGRYTRVDYPKAKRTVIFGISPAGDIVGGFETPDGHRSGYRGSRR